MLNNNEPNIEPCSIPLKMSLKLVEEPITFNLCFLFSRSDAKNIANLDLRHMHLVLQLTIDDRYNQKSWRGL